MLSLAHGLSFEALYQPDGLARLDRIFLERLGADEPALRERLVSGRECPDRLARKEEATLLIEVAPHLEAFIGELFGIDSELAKLRAEHGRVACLYSCKRLFVQRRAATKVKPQDVASFDADEAREKLVERFGEPFTELAFADHVTRWQGDEAEHADALQLALRYAGWAIHTEAGRAWHRTGVLFKVPRKLDPMRLVPVNEKSSQG